MREENTQRQSQERGKPKMTKAKKKKKQETREISLEFAGPIDNENAEKYINRKLKKEQEMIENYNVL